jgi:hypothetical protein
MTWKLRVNKPAQLSERPKFTEKIKAHFLHKDERETHIALASKRENLDNVGRRGMRALCDGAIRHVPKRFRFMSQRTFRRRKRFARFYFSNSISASAHRDRIGGRTAKKIFGLPHESSMRSTVHTYLQRTHWIIHHENGCRAKNGGTIGERSCEKNAMIASRADCKTLLCPCF